MIEVEIKLPVEDLKKIEGMLCKMDFVLSETIVETDTYFDNEAGQIRGNGEALRVRTIISEQTGSEDTVITFKGKKLDQISMTRTELETNVGDGKTAEKLFCALGFHPVEPRVIKKRRSYIKENLRADLDEVKGLGEFLELEILAEEETQKEALLKIENVLRKLGFSMENTVRTSYLTMLQKKYNNVLMKYG